MIRVSIVVWLRAIIFVLGLIVRGVYYWGKGIDVDGMLWELY